MTAARIARPTEKPRVIELLRAFHAAGDFGFAYDPARAERLARISIEGGDLVCLVVGDPAVGLLIGQAGLSAMAPWRFAEELLVWIEPESRGRAWKLLIDAFEAWARERDCQAVKVSSQQHWRGEALGRLWRRQGYRPVETVYSKDL